MQSNNIDMYSGYLGVPYDFQPETTEIYFVTQKYSPGKKQNIYVYAKDTKCCIKCAVSRSEARLIAVVDTNTVRALGATKINIKKNL